MCSRLHLHPQQRAARSTCSVCTHCSRQQRSHLRFYPTQHAAAQPLLPAPTAACSSVAPFAYAQRSIHLRSPLCLHPPRQAGAQPLTPASSAACSNAASFACPPKQATQRNLLRLALTTTYDNAACSAWPRSKKQRNLRRLHPRQCAAAQPPSSEPTAACSSTACPACTHRSLLRRHSPKHAASQRSIQQRSVLRLHPPQHAERRLFRLQLLTAAFSSTASFDRTHSSMQQRTLLRLHAA